MFNPPPTIFFPFSLWLIFINVPTRKNLSVFEGLVIGRPMVLNVTDVAMRDANHQFGYLTGISYCASGK